MLKSLAIIADGNRRWARENGLPQKAGYLQGLSALERCCLWAEENGLEFLTGFCFSTENRKRPAEEINCVMSLAAEYFRRRQDWYVNHGYKVTFAGSREWLPENITELMDKMEEKTENGSRLTLILCFDYGGRDEIIRAVKNGAATEEEITAALIPAPDAIFRPGGEKRLSNFLLWQAAYSELIFSDTLFPALEERELTQVKEEFERRQRRFGM